MKLVFATNNIHKLNEVQLMLGNDFVLKTLKDINCNEDIPETQNTIEGNAQQKAEFIFNNYNVNCFADDTGLEVEALNGEPGVLSARYAGEEKNNEKNIEKLLQKLQNFENRNAHFKTIFCLIINENKLLFEGVVEGKITLEKLGNNGFGYDSIFIPNGSQKTFAEMNSQEKNNLSHRKIALEKMITYLKK